MVSEAAVRSRTFEAGKAIAFDSVVAVFEDLGYTILRANRNSGIVSAEGALEEPARSLSAEFLRKRQAVAGALVEDVGGSTRVTLALAMRTEVTEQTTEVSVSGTGETETSFSFKTTISSDGDELQWKEEAVLEAAAYQDAFDRIEQAVIDRS